MQTQFTLNLNSDRRDQIIFGASLDWRNGQSLDRLVKFDQLSCVQLQQLIDEQFVQGDDRLNPLVAANDLIAFAQPLAQQQLQCEFGGFVASAMWEQQVAITSIRIAGIVVRSLKQQFWGMFQEASTIEITPLKLMAKWNWGVQQCVSSLGELW